MSAFSSARHTTVTPSVVNGPESDVPGEAAEC
jgi:hypothetical protein